MRVGIVFILLWVGSAGYAGYHNNTRAQVDAFFEKHLRPTVEAMNPWPNVKCPKANHINDLCMSLLEILFALPGALLQTAKNMSVTGWYGYAIVGLAGATALPLVVVLSEVPWWHPYNIAWALVATGGLLWALSKVLIWLAPWVAAIVVGSGFIGANAFAWERIRMLFDAATTISELPVGAEETGSARRTAPALGSVKKPPI